MSFMEEKQDFSKYGKTFQENLVNLILDDRSYCDQISEVLDINFLELKYLRLFVQKIFDYRKKYGTHPTRDSLTTILRSDLGSENELLQKQIRDYYVRLQSNEFSVEGAEHIKDVSLDFCKKQKLKEAMIKSVGLIQNSSYDEVSKIINDALKLGTDNNHGYDYLLDFEKRFEIMARNPISTGWELIDNISKGGLGRGELGVVIAPTGCHAKGTKILMYDGSIKKVEDIIVGDTLIGPDSSPRNVLNLHRGREMMYKIIPTKGESFIVNAGHILSLRNTKNDKIVNISVSDYIGKNKNFKHLHKLYRSNAISFNNNNDVKYPYFMGLMLGDGCVTTEQISFTTEDEKLINEIKETKLTENFIMKSWKKNNTECKSYALNYSKNSSMYKYFQDYGLIGKDSGNKFIPNEYKLSSIENRLQLLAGLMDTDGSMANNNFDYISKSKQLAEDVVFISRSLGLAAYMTECTKNCQTGYSGTYYRVSISGDCSIIPTKLSRKKAGVRKQIKNVLNTGFTIEQLDIDNYYGFEVDSDNLYIMGDFTVTHNSGKSMALVHLGVQALKAGLNVVHYTLELQDKVVSLRYDSCITGISLTDVQSCKEQVWDGIQDVPGKLIVKEYPTKSATTNTIKHHLEKLKRKDFKIDMVIVDYGDLLKPINSQREKRIELESIYEELRGLAQTFGCSLWTASQTNRSGLNAEVITMESISEAFNKCFVADFICTISRTVKDKNTNEGRMFIAKNRNGPDGLIFPIFMDTSNVKIKVLQQSSESVADILVKSAKEQEKSLKEKYKSFKKGA